MYILNGYYFVVDLCDEYEFFFILNINFIFFNRDGIFFRLCLLCEIKMLGILEIYNDFVKYIEIG